MMVHLVDGLRKAGSHAELFSLANNMVYGGNFSDYFVFG